MDYLDSIDWKEIKKDLQKGMEKGMAAMKKGAIVAQKKAGELTEEGKRQFKILTLKTKVHESISDLGARVYSLMNSAKAKNPALDAGVKDLMTKIKDLEGQIAAVEGKNRAAKPKAGKKK
jgi:tetrahydromethanopterin S-methyltransferase subunit A